MLATIWELKIALPVRESDRIRKYEYVRGRARGCESIPACTARLRQLRDSTREGGKV